MRAPPASNEELFTILGFAALLAAAILYWKTSKQHVQPVQTVIAEVKPVVVEKRAPIVLGPGWAGGRWLGEGDFVHHQERHPFHDQPRYAGHPLEMPALSVAPSLRGSGF